MTNKGGWHEKRYVKCGKERCQKCKNGGGHGPYKYHVWRDPVTGRRRARCLGRWDFAQQDKGVSDGTLPNKTGR